MATPKTQHTNRLTRESSPYLLQHAHNPVDWHPWGPDAFEKAEREGKPVFLSVGYSTCHWCHVMAHESFEDEQVADLLNEHFVSIKVDREELPDVDEQYMLATQLFTRRGGWPNSVWLTPDRRPWYAGTYFPKEDRGPQPGFKTLLRELAKTWRERRDDAEKQAEQFAEAIRSVGAGEHLRSDKPLSRDIITQAIDYLRDHFDTERGGFGRAPKFPPHGALALLIAHQRRRRDPRTPGPMDMITHTLDLMAMGGVYDHVGGGFHRYSTDARWFLPHFEKMLYDNAQLVRNYADAHALAGDRPEYRRVVAETFAWLTREMTDEAGGFYSAIDADSEGEEGKFYLWTRDEVYEVLGEEDAEVFERVYGITKDGTYYEEATGEHTGTNIPYLAQPIGYMADDLEIDEPELRRRLDAMKRKLLEVRDRRPRPHLDDKVLSGWNGLMIGALARAGRVFEEPDYTRAAERAARFVLENMTRDDRLLRTWRAGEAKLPAYLDDYAYLTDGLLELHEATGEAHWLDEARRLAGVVIDHFHDEEAGGFFSTSDEHDEVLLRAKEIGAGGNVPSGNGVMAGVLIRLARLTGEERYGRLAVETLDHARGMMWAGPHGSEALILALDQLYEAQEELPGGLPGAAALTEPPSDADAAVARGPVRAEAFVERDVAAPGDTLRAAIRIRIDPGYHIYGPAAEAPAGPGGAPGLPTVVHLHDPPDASLGDVRYPEPRTKHDPVLEKELGVYEGAVALLVPVRIADRAEDGPATIRLELQAQACDDQACLAPELYTLDLPITIRRGPHPTPAPRHPELFASLEES